MYFPFGVTTVLYQLKVKAALPPTGSPPHTRGKVYKIIISFIQSGITPAYTGKSFTYQNSVGYFQDHPRIHGEKYHSEYESVNGEGSPPHTRGKVIAFNDIQLFNRITPAYTGKRDERLETST